MIERMFLLGHAFNEYRVINGWKFGGASLPNIVGRVMAVLVAVLALAVVEQRWESRWRWWA